MEQTLSGNTILGSYTDFTGIDNFLYNGGTYTPFSMPGAFSTVATGISGNTVVGNYDGPEIGAFLYNGSTFTTVTVPGSLSTSLNGIDGTSVVGTYIDAAFQTHAFLWTDVSTAPEPSSLVLGVLGVLCVVASRRRHGWTGRVG